MATKRTYQPSKTKRKRKLGYLKRSSSRKGLAILKRKILKGRKKISIS